MSINEQSNWAEAKKEIDRLKQKEYFLEKKVRDLQSELNDYIKRENLILKEIDEYERIILSLKQPKSLINTLGVAKDTDDFINPKLPNYKTSENYIGLEKHWEELMYGYTDNIFIDADTPDLLLYIDESKKAYVSITGNTTLFFPITQDKLTNYNIIKVRPLTSDERSEVVDKYELD